MWVGLFDIDFVINKIRYISYVVNLIILLGWIKNRVLLRKFLVGKWEGNFHDSTAGNGHHYQCQLIVAKQNDRDNAAFFYYEARSLNNGTVILRGLDRLQDSEEDNFFFCLNRRWKATYVREFNKEEGNSSASNYIPPHYEWTCRVVRLWYRPKMTVKIDANGRIFDGTLEKK